MKTCSVCGIEISYRSVSGMCKPHFLRHLNTDPAMKARQNEGVRAWAKNNPDAVSRRSLKIWSKRRSNPEGMAALAERMRTVCQPAACTPESIARRDNAKRALSISRAKNPWCPDEYRPEYRNLVKYKNFTGAEARAIIEAQMAADAAKAKLVTLSPFERQMLALERGACLQDNVRVDCHSDSAAELRAKLA